MTLTKILTAILLLALTYTVLLDIHWIRRRKFGMAIGISAGFITIVAILLAVLMRFITRT